MAGAQLLDTALSDGSGALPPRLRAIKFPAALDWLRVEDVIRVAHEEGAVDSKSAFRNRWPVRDAFVRDLVIYCLEYRDNHGLSAPQAYAARQMLTDAQLPMSDRVRGFISVLLRELVSNPRSFLLAHIAPMIMNHPALHESLVRFTRSETNRWQEVYAEVIQMVGGQLRPGWTLERLALALQCLLDGLVLRRRVDPEHSVYSDAGFAADAALGLAMAALDLESTGLTTSQWVDTVIAHRVAGQTGSAAPGSE